MRYFYFLLLAVLAASCAESTIKIKTADNDKPFLKDAYIRTTDIGIIKEHEEIQQEPLIEIISPKNLEVINGTSIALRLNISNFKLVSPDKYPKKGEGHVQIWIDGMEFRGSRTEFIFENESNGSHTIKAELMLSNNTVLPYSNTIKVFINKYSENGKEKVVEKVAVSQPKESRLRIVSPKDVEMIKNSKVTIELQAENFDIVPVGEPVKEGEGHFHVWLDSEKMVTTDKTVAFENIVSGKHSIVAELVKSNHSSLSPRVIQSITVNVESGYVPKVEAPQQGVSEFTVEADDNGFYPDKIQAKVGDNVKINFKFRDDSIYFAGLDIKGPFPDIKYKLKGEQPITAEFTIKDETKITSYWPSSGVKKAVLTVENVQK